MLKVLTILTFSFLLTACASVEKKQSPSYSHYSGYYFDAIINDAKVVSLDNVNSKPKMKNYLRLSDVRWQVANPISGGIVVRVSQNQLSQNTIGQFSPIPKVIVVPLEGQNLNTYNRLSKANDVRVNGSAVVTNKRFVKSNILPAGAYIFRVRVRGSQNWDRKEVYVEIK